MQERREVDRCAVQRRTHFPPLAPRNSTPSSSRTATTGSPSGRHARLSHRSRAGCWTCRGRKVKCDEVRPRCGPCKRLNRECDWDHRWNFSNATLSTQGRYSNVSTTGNPVWDSNASDDLTSPIVNGYDDLPEFISLLTDEERERKAETRRPGTFSVVVTPESFSDLPEYAESVPPVARGASTRPGRGTLNQNVSVRTRWLNHIDSNTIILDRFEDVSPSSPGPILDVSGSGRDSPTESLQQLPMTSPPTLPTMQMTSFASDIFSDHHLINHFRHYIVPRLIQPQQHSTPDTISQGSTKHALELEATRYPPLHYAICAISALNLSYIGQSSLEEGLQHYQQALAAQTPGTNPDDLLSDGVFFRHFLLFIYDICIPMENDEGGANMWAEHLTHLRWIATQRHRNRGSEPNACTLWTICQIDMYACLLGSGNCDFFSTVLRQNMLPKLEQQVPCIATVHNPSSRNLLPIEVQVFPPILNLNQGIVIHAAKLAQTAQAFRKEANRQETVPPGTYARWQAHASQLQNDIITFWNQTYPNFLGPESPQAGQQLPERVSSVFDNVSIYLSTCSDQPYQLDRDKLTSDHHRPPFSTTQSSSIVEPASSSANAASPLPTSSTCSPTPSIASAPSSPSRLDKSTSATTSPVGTPCSLCS